jgi:hypothetical protein
MDPKGKGMVVNDKEKESLFNEPRDNKPTDSGSSHKKRDGNKKRRIKRIIYYDSDASSSSPRDDDDDSSIKERRLIKTTPLIISASLKVQMHIYFRFLLENLRTLMEKTILSGVIKCVVIYSLSILVFGKLWKTGCTLIVQIIICL